MKVLITGASGFIGSFLVEKGLELGYEVWAGMRGKSSKKFLPSTGVKYVELDFSSSDSMRRQLAAYKQDYGAWDYIIHAAGVTKCLDKKDFFRVNYEGTKNFVDSLVELDMKPKKFIYLSSLSVFGPVREKYPYKLLKQ